MHTQLYNILMFCLTTEIAQIFCQPVKIEVSESTLKRSILYSDVKLKVHRPTSLLFIYISPVKFLSIAPYYIANVKLLFSFFKTFIVFYFIFYLKYSQRIQNSEFCFIVCLGQFWLKEFVLFMLCFTFWPKGGGVGRAPLEVLKSSPYIVNSLAVRSSR